jgi:hypothetical protein
MGGSRMNLSAIKPGKNYPAMVRVKDNGEEVKFLLQSYYVGMYAAIYFPGETTPLQCGDSDNSTFVQKLKKDLAKALERGAEVEIGEIRPVVTGFEEVKP